MSSSAFPNRRAIPLVYMLVVTMVVVPFMGNAIQGPRVCNRSADSEQIEFSPVNVAGGEQAIPAVWHEDTPAQACSGRDHPPMTRDKCVAVAIDRFPDTAVRTQEKTLVPFNTPESGSRSVQGVSPPNYDDLIALKSVVLQI